MNYGEKITALRKEHGLTQAELGDKLSVTAQAVSKWENNQSEPDLETVRKICELFEIQVNDFFTEASAEETTVEETDVNAEENALPTLEDKPTANTYAQLSQSATQTQPTIIIGYCQHCQKPIEQKDKYHVTGKGGRHIICEECHQKQVQAEKAREKSENRKWLWIGLIVGLVASGIMALIVIPQIGVENDYTKLVYSENDPFALQTWQAVVNIILTFTLVSQLFWMGSVTECMMFFIRSFKMPGIIFTWDLDGLQFLIVMKIVLAILSFVLSAVVFIIGLFITGAYSVFAFVPALIKKIKG